MSSIKAAKVKTVISMLVAILLICNMAQAGFETVYHVSAEGGSYNIALNGDMEKISNGIPQNWTTVSSVQLSDITDIPDNTSGKYGEHAVKVESVHGGGISQVIKDFVTETTYTFSADVRLVNNVKEVFCEVYCDNAQNQSVLNKSFSIKSTTGISNWQHGSVSITIPENTVKVHIRMRNLHAVDSSAKLESYIDNVSLIGELPSYIIDNMEFNKELENEEALNAPYKYEFPNGLYDKDEPYNGQSDILISESFTQGLGVFGSGHPAYAKWDSTNACMYFNVPKGEVVHPLFAKSVKIEGGAEYQVSYRYKVLSGTETTPLIKLEYAPKEVTVGVAGCGEKYVRYDNTIRDGQWHEVNLKVYPPSNAASMNVMVRMMQEAVDEVSSSEAMVDDIQICRTYPSQFAKLDAGDIFYYSDKTQGSLQVKINSLYSTSYTNAKVKYEIFDGEESLFEDTVNGINTKVNFNLSILKNRTLQKGYEEGHPYRAIATVYEADGVTVKAKTVQNVYVYNRPNFLKNNVFYKEGKTPVAPVYAYHVNKEHYKKTAEAGVNIVQMAADTPSQLIEMLDEGNKYGIMGLVCLYPNGLPAGHKDNLKSTFEFAEAVKNHPALFGYCVMDEVFSGIANPEPMLEASYRAIHKVDKNHPVCVMEAGRSHYEEAAKYVDILLIDPYSSAYQRNAAQAVTYAKRVTDKPVYALLEAFRQGLRYPTPDDGRNNNWQALISGADAIGYYSISDSWVVSSKESYPIWDTEHTGGHLWEALLSYNQREKEIAQNHFIFNEGTKLFDRQTYEPTKNIADTTLDYWYYAWQDGEDTYLILLGFLNPEGKVNTQEVTVPLSGKYAALNITGRENQSIRVVENALTVNLLGSEALLYKLSSIDEGENAKMITAYYETNDSGYREMVSVSIADEPSEEMVITHPELPEKAEATLYFWDEKSIKPLGTAIKYMP